MAIGLKLGSWAFRWPQFGVKAENGISNLSRESGSLHRRGTALELGFWVFNLRRVGIKVLK